MRSIYVLFSRAADLDSLRKDVEFVFEEELLAYKKLASMHKEYKNVRFWIETYDVQTED